VISLPGLLPPLPSGENSPCPDQVKGASHEETPCSHGTPEMLQNSPSLARVKRHTYPSALRRNLIAEGHGLQPVRGKIPLPDLRIEYETREGEVAHVDLELATEHYRGRNLAEKVRAGFSIYAHAQDAAGLRRVLDQKELTAEILSL
jgi:hypothetical protein